MYVLVQDGAVAAYPYSVASLRADNPETSFAMEMPDERLADFGVFPVLETERPAAAVGYALVEGTPEASVGGWRQTWSLIERDLAEVKDELRAMLTRQRDTILQGGWTHDFGVAGVHTLDLRHADDKANWTLLLIKTQGMIAAGGGGAMITIRTAANASINVTATEANAAMVAFLGWGEAVLAHKWNLDEEIAEADLAALGAIDVEAGWPS
ncbi:hypothetical protein [Rhizorhabdus sp.]|uniref:DUF4376 domain-containing protein n=1 Tax=Rhizorhabdus sp. TaxID=1968843 RepID=UPI0019BCE6C3|nr:hypothetical protein [Rhizorhabdus sp.]MBD3762475.1 hypothetical protein [Rhizorhabdus sp.]